MGTTYHLFDTYQIESEWGCNQFNFTGEHIEIDISYQTSGTIREIFEKHDLYIPTYDLFELPSEIQLLTPESIFQIAKDIKHSKNIERYIHIIANASQKGCTLIQEK